MIVGSFANVCIEEGSHVEVNFLEVVVQIQYSFQPAVSDDFEG